MKNKIIDKYKQNKKDYNIILGVEATTIAITLFNIL